MKDYNRIVIWLDYFNSALTRKEGRRLPLNKSIKNPTEELLSKAAKRLNLTFEYKDATYPKRSLVKTGYISIKKKKIKSKTVSELASTMSLIKSKDKNRNN